MVEVIRSGVLVATVLALFLLANGYRRGGLVIGLLGQPFWFFISFYHSDWALTVATILITLSYMSGIYKLIKDPFRH